MEANASLEEEEKDVNDGNTHRGKIILLFGIRHDCSAFLCRCSGENPLLCAAYYFSLFLLGKTEDQMS